MFIDTCLDNSGPSKKAGVNMKNQIINSLAALSILLFSTFSAEAQQRGIAITSDQILSGSWGTYHALVIGINDYKEWPKLQTAVKDATVIREILISRYGFADKNVILRTDAAASRFQIERDLRYLATAMEPSDNLLVYYAGHGQLDDLTGDGYWVPAEGAMKNPSTWVANSYIKAIFSSERVKAKNVVVIADSCYSGSMLRGGPSLMSLDDKKYRKKLARKAALRSRQVISSGGVEPVTDGGAEGHSLFAYYLIDALRKNEREVIDLENLFHTKVWKKVTEIGDQSPNVGRLKTPMDQDGQFVLYNAAWANERAQRQAALEAQKQEQIRQKEAVLSAELALQRQRMEMEKQKLALEKEQLAHQKALEMERLKLEKQKQEFEYAKLQAQLEKMKARQEQNELRTKANELTAEKLHASAAPRSLNSRKAARDSYSLAMFPTNINAGEYGEGYVGNIKTDAVELVASLTLDDDRLSLNYCPKEVGGSAEGCTLLQDALKNETLNVWKKKSFLSKKEPDWEAIKKSAKKINIDLIVVMDGTVHPADYTLYLYDIEKDKVYQKKSNSDYYEFKSGTRIRMRALFKEFFRAQKDN